MHTVVSQWKLALLMCVLLLLSACKSPREGVQKQAGSLRDAYVEDVARLGALQPYTLSWDDALAMMQENNLELRQVRDDVTRAQEQIERVFLDLLPTLNVSSSLRKALTQLGTIDKNDLSVDVFAVVNVPGVINMRTRYYASVLGKIRSEWALELKQRELTARLYEQFVQYENLQLRRQNLEQSQLWTQASSLESRLQTNPETIEREQQLFAIKLEENAQQKLFATLLGSYSHQWMPESGALPDLGYAESPLRLEDPDKVAVLVRQLQAAELEGVRLRLRGIELQYWPDFSATVSSPPLYSYRGAQSSGWSVDDVTVSAFVPLRIDTQLRTSYQLRDAKRQAELTHERMRQEITHQVQQYLLAQRELELVQKQLQVANLRWEALEQTPRGLSIEEWRAQLRNSILLSEQRANLRLQKARIETMFWVVDETRWPRQNDLNDNES